MCVIIACPPNHVISRENLLDAIYENKDGAGYMFAVNGELIIDRDAHKPERIVEGFLSMRERYPAAWAVFHARLMTHGRVCDENTHPFTVPGRPWALAHNGVMGLSDGPWGDRSDSRIFAEDHIARKSWNQLQRSKAKVEKWLQGDKVVILSARRERGGRCLILNEDLGTWSVIDGNWYSHLLYHSRRYGNYRRTGFVGTGSGVYGSGYGWRDEWDEWDDDDPIWDAGALPGKTDSTLIARAAVLLGLSEDDVTGLMSDPASRAEIEDMVDEADEEEVQPDNTIPGHWDTDSGLFVGDDGTLWRAHDTEKDWLVPYELDDDLDDLKGFVCADCGKDVDACQCPLTVAEGTVTKPELVIVATPVKE